jgi:Domain of unknown function (DUF5615)
MTARARFLIDENLTLALAPLAHRRGFEAYHLRDLNLLGLPDAALMPHILNGGYCFVTRNAPDFRGPAASPGAGGEYAGVPLHAGLVCLHGPTGGFTQAQQIEAFAVALDVIEAEAGGDPVTLLIEITWGADGIDYALFDLPP